LTGGDALKIDIIGSVASGKTTLAKEISKKYQIPCYEKDNVVWERTINGDKKRNSKERDRIFDEIIKRENWIVEGSPVKMAV
jgi:adenylate kinase family enzyme